MYLQRRNRIVRISPAIRDMVRETVLTPNDFIVPLFIDEGENSKTEIASMPGYYRNSLDITVKEVKEMWSMGLKSILIFVKSKDRRQAASREPAASRPVAPAPESRLLDHPPRPRRRHAP